VVEKPNKLQAAMMAGVVFGLLSAIPFVNLINFCCCLWLIIGGMVAARTLIKRSPFPVNSGDGAAVGAIAGSIAAVINLVIGIPLGLLTAPFVSKVVENFFMQIVTDPNMREQIERQMAESQNQPFAQQIATQRVLWLIFSAVSIGLAALGGVIGVALFEKRKGQVPPSSGTSGYPPSYPQQPPTGTQSSPPPGAEPPRY
jgi:hypothetical protein